MNTLENIAIKIAKKALSDIDMWHEDMEGPYCKYIDNSWLISFGFLAEDFGRDSDGKSRYQIIVTIDDITGIALEIISKGNFILLNYESIQNEYTVKKRT